MKLSMALVNTIEADLRNVGECHNIIILYSLLSFDTNRLKAKQSFQT